MAETTEGHGMDDKQKETVIGTTQFREVTMHCSHLQEVSSCGDEKLKSSQNPVSFKFK